ncbi:hypothetical protein VB711_01570 [Cronbergia sp. UHCC 0137]|uniref:hypothetical protein n=1 Tax=Cronbergia sp. UHCC 0137 TaxID=3110239 RepID=UPI002B21B6D0|nr:hypothetical protein [Cronbergia sp. UHCC 0137]MEA5616532.1 hypothetical protein [Cronbergia sp. UHCC 0137]
MTDKKLEELIIKTVKKVIKKEISKLQQNNLITVSTQSFDIEEDTGTTAELIDDIYDSSSVSLPTQEKVELDHKLRELKFKQELRKDWILFILKDVVVYAATIIFIFTIAGFYLFTVIKGY